MNFQLWSKDEYGQTSIVMTSKDVNKVIDEAKRSVTEVNMENALCGDEKEKNWEAYFVEFIADVQDGEDNDTVIVYAGTRPPLNKHLALMIQLEENECEEILVSDLNPEIRIFIGNLDKKACYAKNGKRQYLNSFDATELQRKSVYYIRKQ